MAYQCETTDPNASSSTGCSGPGDGGPLDTWSTLIRPASTPAFATATRNVQNNEHITYPLESARKR